MLGTANVDVVKRVNGRETTLCRARTANKQLLGVSATGY